MPTNDEDPTRVLDGWVPGGNRGNPDEDPTRILDGWNPAAAAAPRIDPSLPLVEAWQPSAHGALPAAEASQLPRDLNLQVNTRYSKFDTSDVTDVDAVWQPRSFDANAANDAGRRPDSQLGDFDVLHRRATPRVLAAWKPGAWIGAVRTVFGSVAQVVSTPQGPVVDTFAPHVLLALWEPQNIDQPFLHRFPQRVLLSAVSPEDAGEELLGFLPPEAELWLAAHDIDWALAGEAVLLHEPGLRDFQLKELRAFVEAERLAVWERVNKAYKLPAPGQPIERLDEQA